jgi:high affinity Mn2+ porin
MDCTSLQVFKRCLAALVAMLTCALAWGADEERYSLHGQFTSVTQRQSAFRSPYQGDNSLTPQRAQKETADITLYIGARLWPGGELYLNPELDHGFGLSNTLGAAGFPSGEAYKVGKNRPYLRMSRAFVRQVVALGGDDESVEPGPNALGGRVAGNRLTFSVGKFSLSDFFDGNSYAHDPRADFLNWSIVEAGAFDYAADAWGYTQGAVAEWQVGNWTLRLGFVALSDHPNSTHIDTTFSQHAGLAEAEHRHSWVGRPGKMRVLAFTNSGRMGAYDEAVQLASAGAMPADTAAVRRRASKSGWAAGIEQEVATDVSAFLRVSGSQGQHEAFDFTEINRSVSGGVVLKGGLWGQPLHSWGLGLADNAISGAAQRYFRAGGIGILIGDGQLPNAGHEQIVETFYSVRFAPELSLTGDWQRIANPAYNRDRGPVSVLGLRLHAEF